MAVAVVAFVGAKQVDAEASGTFNAGNDNSDSFVEGTQAIGLKVSSTTQLLYEETLLSGPVDVSSGGAEEGEHIFGYINALTPVDTLANGGFGIVVGEENATTDAIGQWYVGPFVGYTGGFAAFVINPEADFDEVVAGTPAWTLSGNPAQLHAIDKMGGRIKTITMISGNFDNALVDSFAVGLGYRYTRGDGASDPGSFDDFVTFELASANRFAALRTVAGILFPMCQLIVGDTTANDHEFVANGQTVRWLDTNVAADFYKFFVEEGSGTTILTLSTCTLDVEDLSQTALPSFDFSGITTCTLDTINIVGAHAVDGIVLDSVPVVTNGVWASCGQITAGGADVTGLTILDPTNDGAVLVTGVTDLDDWSDIVIDGAGIGGATTDAAIEIDIAAAGPHEMDLDNFTFQNQVGSSVDLHFLDQGTDTVYTINVLNGGSTPTFTQDRGGDTINIVVNPVTLELTVQEQDATKIQDARVLVRAGDAGALPFRDTVTMTRVGIEVSVAHTAHGLEDGEKVIIDDANENEYNGIHVIYNVTTNAYDFSLEENTELDDAYLLVRAQNYSGSGDWLNEARIGGVGDGQFGSTGGADTNDPLHKALDGIQYAYFPGGVSNNMSTPDSAAVSITGDIDIRIRSATLWTTGERFAFLAKATSLSLDGYLFEIERSGVSNDLVLKWDDGSVLQTANSTVEISTVLSGSELAWVRVTMDVDNGASDSEVKFYWSTDDTDDPDAVSWTQLGATVLLGSTTSIEDGGDPLKIGLVGGSGDSYIGDMYRAVLYNGIDGTIAFDAVVADATEPYATFTERSANAATVTINRSSSGLVTTVIDRSQMLYTTDDYHEFADHADLDFSDTDDFTIMGVFRLVDADPSASWVLMNKAVGIGGTQTGYRLYGPGSAVDEVYARISDGTLNTTDLGGAALADNVLSTATLVRDVTADDVTLFNDGSPTAGVTDTTTATLANGNTLGIGATPDAPGHYIEGQIMAIAVWRTNLSPAQVLEAHGLLLDHLRTLPATPATGTIKSSAVIIDELTTAGGIADDTRTYASDQEIDGLRSRVRKSSSGSEIFKEAPVSGTIDSATGLSIIVTMTPDE